jgi:CRP-like cAMP-binding protein
MNPITVVVHVGYSLMLCALLARDVLWLRALLIGAQSCIGTYAWFAGVPSITAWNGLFVVLNTGWVVRIVRERRAVTLPEELRRFHERQFAALTAPEFLHLWTQGARRSLRDERLTTNGTYPGTLYFLISGTVRVSVRGALITDVPAGYFVGEMSLLTGEPANADVDAVGAVDVMTWPAGDLRQLAADNSVLWTKVQSVLGHDVVEKIKRNRPGSAQR